MGILICGLNGAGKSTLGRLLAQRALRPLNGKLVVVLVEWLPSRQALPQNDGPTEDVALLRIVDALEHFWCHPRGTALVVCHERFLITCGAEIANF